MRSLVIALSIVLAGSSVVVAQDSSTVGLRKLEQLRQQKRDLANRHRAAIIVLNESNVPGVETRLFNEAAILFSSKGYEIVNQPDASAAVAAHGKGAAWTNEELALIADRLQVETVAVATLTHYQAEHGLGLPLPTMSVRTDAHVTMDGAVYKRSANQIVWKDTVSRRERNLVGGGMVTRNEARRRTSTNTIDQLFGGFLNKRS